MKFLETMAVMMMAVTPLPAFSYDTAFGAVQLTDSDAKVDGGTRPNARVIVQLTAPEGMFIWAPSIVLSPDGSRGLRSATPKSKPSDAVPSDLASLAVQSITYEVYAKGNWNPAATSSVTAAAHAVALAYPIEAFATLVMDRLNTAAEK